MGLIEQGIHVIPVLRINLKMEFLPFLFYDIIEFIFHFNDAVLDSFNKLSLNFFLASCTCHFEVPSEMLSMEAISLWLNPSMAKRLKTCLSILDSCWILSIK